MTNIPILTNEITTTDPELQAHVDALESDLQHNPFHATMASEDSMAVWYLGKAEEIRALRDKIEQQAAIMLRQLDNRERALQWRWGGMFKSVIDRMLRSQGGRKKSIDLPTGRAGYRAHPASVRVTNEIVAVEWAQQHCPDAIKTIIGRKTPIKQHIESTGEQPPGIEYTPAADGFYPPIGRPALEAIITPPQLEGDRQ